MKAEKRAVQRAVVHEGISGVFTFEKIFVSKTPQGGAAFTSYTIDEAIEMIEALLEIDLVKAYFHTHASQFDPHFRGSQR